MVATHHSLSYRVNSKHTDIAANWRISFFNGICYEQTGAVAMGLSLDQY